MGHQGRRSRNYFNNLSDRLLAVKKAFTLIELMITIVLFVALAIVSVLIFRTALLAWSSQETRAGIDIDIDYAVENMTRDLREAEIIGFANDDEIRFTKGLNDDTSSYIYYFYNSSDSYPPAFDQDAYTLMRASLSSVSGRDLSTGSFTYGNGTIRARNILPPGGANPSDLSFRVPEAFYYAIHAGNLYTADDIDFQSSSGTVTGDISDSDEVQNEGSMTINDTIYEGDDSNTTLPFCNISYYADIADTSVSGNETFNTGGSPYSGIYYVDGDVTIQSNVTINGSVIATGDIDLQNSHDVIINPVYPYPTLIAAGDIDADSLSDSTLGDSSDGGIVYARGNMSMDNLDTVTFYGNIIAGGNIVMTNGSDFTVTYDSDIESVSPPFFYYSSMNIDLYIQRKDELLQSTTQVRQRL